MFIEPYTIKTITWINQQPVNSVGWAGGLFSKKICWVSLLRQKYWSVHLELQFLGGGGMGLWYTAKYIFVLNFTQYQLVIALSD